MKNENAKELINICNIELVKIEHFKEATGSATPIMASLTRYSVIKCCGTIEQCFKTIIFDSLEIVSAPQAMNYIEKRFRNGSMNPSFDNIMSSLKYFDETWKDNVKENINVLTDKERIKSSLSSLNKNRNKFAHGESITVAFDQVVKYFNDACKILEVLDSVITDD